MLNELEIITHLQKKFPSHIGDDAAVIAFSGTKRYVITNDLLVEDVHFRLRYTTPTHLAHKALHVNLSDIAAMGGQPQFVLLGMAVPLNYADNIKLFLNGFSKACKAASVILIGGDTTKSPDKLFISLTVIGVAEERKIKYRHTAKPGDWIGLVGQMGHAHIGLTALESVTTGLNSFKKDFLKPQARVLEGLWLGAQSGVTSMMDTSDGLLIDLKRLCRASQVGAEIYLENLPDTKTLNTACQRLKLDPIETMLTGGEDYSLLLTIHPDKLKTIAKQFNAAFGYAIKCLGRVTSGKGVSFMQNGHIKPLTLQPFSHFGEQL
ncbi:MAG: thiamine-phosphate kinase [Legionellales bacterium]|nr:thiamine-phosphate kinase [Legionellales bacterium]